MSVSCWNSLDAIRVESAPHCTWSGSMDAMDAMMELIFNYGLAAKINDDTFKVLRDDLQKTNSELDCLHLAWGSPFGHSKEAIHFSISPNEFDQIIHFNPGFGDSQLALRHSCVTCAYQCHFLGNTAVIVRCKEIFLSWKDNKDAAQIST